MWKSFMKALRQVGEEGLGLLPLRPLGHEWRKLRVVKNASQALLQKLTSLLHTSRLFRVNHTEHQLILFSFLIFYPILQNPLFSPHSHNQPKWLVLLLFAAKIRECGNKKKCLPTLTSHFILLNSMKVQLASKIFILCSYPGNETFTRTWLK